jgi:DNA-binding transcriptional LysR family regulator
MSEWEGLEEIVAIADTGSFVGAARRLNVSPSQVSRIVQRLEARLKAELFERTTRSVRPTELGRMLVDQSRRIIDERDEALSMARGESEMQGALKLTCSTTLGERFMAPIVGRFIRAHPRISVSLELTNRVVDLVAESFDIGIRTGHPVDQRLDARQIGARSLVVCAAPVYLAHRNPPQAPSDLEAHDCLIGTSGVWHFSEKGTRRTWVPAGRFRCNSGTAIVSAALDGLGLCQLPEFYVREHLATGRLVRLLDSYLDAPEPIWAVYPQRRHALPKVQAMLATLEAELSVEMASRAADRKF